MFVCFLNSVISLGSVKVSTCALDRFVCNAHRSCSFCSWKLLVFLWKCKEQCKAVSKGSTGPRSGFVGAALHLVGNSAKVKGSFCSSELCVANDCKGSANGQTQTSHPSPSPLQGLLEREPFAAEAHRRTFGSGNKIPAFLWKAPPKGAFYNSLVHSYLQLTFSLDSNECQSLAIGIKSQLLTQLHC